MITRKEERKQVTTFTPVYDLQENFLLSYLGNLTLTGALMVSEEPIETDRNLTLAIEFRETSEVPAATRMIIPAHVVWCQPKQHRTYYAGIKFLEMTKKSKRAIKTLLEKRQFNYNKTSAQISSIF